MTPSTTQMAEPYSPSYRIYAQKTFEALSKLLDGVHSTPWAYIDASKFTESVTNRMLDAMARAGL